MSLNSVGHRHRHRGHLSLVAAGVAALAACFLMPAIASAGPSDVTLPRAHAGFDHQIGGAYTPPAGVAVVSRDHNDSPAAGKYNICYVNAFQAQPGAEKDWDADLLLRDANGDIVYEDGWGEALLDVRTADKRQRVAAKVGTWIDECASKGFGAVEPDNFDSFSRSDKLLTKAQAQSSIRLLSAHAHDKGLAIAQKNTSKLSGNGVRCSARRPSPHRPSTDPRPRTRSR